MLSVRLPKEIEVDTVTIRLNENVGLVASDDKITFTTKHGKHSICFTEDGVLSFEFVDKDHERWKLMKDGGKVGWRQGGAYKTLGRQLVAVNLGPFT